MLEGHRFELLLVNAQHVKNLPGRKTNVADACWLAQLLECGLLRGSFVPTPAMGRLRDLTRYRTKLVQERARETQRVQKTLDAGIKLDSVVSDVMGKAARRMIEALIAGERDRGAGRDGADSDAAQNPGAAPRAGRSLRGAPRALLLRMHLDHIDQLSSATARIDSQGELQRSDTELS